MFNLVDMINLQMRKNGIESQAELLRRMNDLNNGERYDKQHLSDIFLGKQSQIRYLYALEQVFKLPENALVRMIELDCVPRKNIRNGGKISEVR